MALNSDKYGIIMILILLTPVIEVSSSMANVGPTAGAAPLGRALSPSHAEFLGCAEPDDRGSLQGGFLRSEKCV